MNDAVELFILPKRDALPVRARLTGIVTTIGSEDSADIQLSGVRPQWAVIRKHKDGLTLSLLDSGDSHRLKVGRPISVDGVTLSLEARAAASGLPVARLAEVLTDATRPDEALSLMLREIIAAGKAESGAVLLADAGDFSIAVAQDASGNLIEDAASLLSDTIVREALRSATTVHVGDAATDTRFGEVPSVVSLGLRCILCAPMTLKNKVVGAIFVGKREISTPFSPRFVRELGLLASLAVPLIAQMRRVLERHDGAPAGAIVGEHATMAELRKLIERVAPSDLAVLLSGETGTGKEVVARAIHGASLRRDKPLVAINCSAVPEGLLAAELFGAKKGAFSGAVTDRKGRIEHADGSTLFLDEVGDMPLSMQAALLRVLEEREVVRVGETTPRPVDFRLVAATHRKLDEEVAAGRFRQDLLYRLNEFRMVLPPLRDRGDDVLLLAQLFLRQTEAQLGLRTHTIGADVEAALRAHGWPGNVRELRATMRRAAVLADTEALEVNELQLGTPRRASDPLGNLGSLDRSLAAARDEFVARYAAAVLEQCGGDREQAARRLSVSLRSLYRHLSPND